MIKGIDIAAYLVKDPKAEIAFYRDVLGMQPTEIDDEGRGAEFTLADGSTFGVWKPEGGEKGGAIMFAVDDAKAAVEHYRAKGLQLSDVVESPVCFMSFGEDPEGNGIIIHQRKS
jgi:predicted enzyme related to lactoylglutathione lyase